MKNICSQVKMAALSFLLVATLVKRLVSKRQDENDDFPNDLLD